MLYEDFYTPPKSIPEEFHFDIWRTEVVQSRYSVIVNAETLEEALKKLADDEWEDCDERSCCPEEIREVNTTDMDTYYIHFSDGTGATGVTPDKYKVDDLGKVLS